MLKNLFLWLWQASAGIRSKLVLVMLCGLCYTAASLAFVYVSKEAIDRVTHGEVVGYSAVCLYGALLLGLYLLELGLNLWMGWIENHTEIVVENGLRHRLYSHLMRANWEEWERFHSGDVLNRLEEDVRIVADTLSRSVPQLITTGVQVLAAFAFLYAMNPMLAWCVVFIMPFFLLVSKTYFRGLRELTKGIRSTDSEVQSVMQESLQHRMLIQSMEQNGAFVDRLEGLQSSLYGQTMHRTKFNLFSRGMVSLGFIAGYMTAFLWGLVGLQEGAITYGMMTAFLQLVNRIQRPTVALTNLIPGFVYASASMERIEEMESLHSEQIGEGKMLQGTGGIRIENMTFRYKEGERDIYWHFSHDFTPGSRTAIIGETGAGKSTLVKLILSLLKPTEGNICLYDKTDQKEVSPETRGNLVYVPQGNSLLSGTIRSNLLLGNADATDGQMWQALHVAAADFVKELPLQLDARCGEGGDGLSEGQAQRIAIARGLLRPGSILLLDEFSASLDRETERVLIKRLINNAKDKTMLFITHREMVLEYCDEVVRLPKT